MRKSILAAVYVLSGSIAAPSAHGYTAGEMADNCELVTSAPSLGQAMQADPFGAGVRAGTCAGMINAIAETIQIGPDGRIACPLAGKSAANLISVFKGFLGVHPEARSADAPAIIAGSFRAAFCPNTSRQIK
jgi:hypothetical protein